MRARGTGWLVLAGAMVLLSAGCGSDSESSVTSDPLAPATTGAATTTSAARPVPAVSTTRLTDGTYSTAELTPDQMTAAGMAAGLARSDVESFVASDGVERSAVMTLRLAQGGWSLLQAYDGKPAEVGWRGSYEVIDDDTVIATTDCGSITYQIRAGR